MHCTLNTCQTTITPNTVKHFVCPQDCKYYVYMCYTSSTASSFNGLKSQGKGQGLTSLHYAHIQWSFNTANTTDIIYVSSDAWM